MTSPGKTLDVDGVPLLTVEQGQELAYSIPEGANVPPVLTRFLIGQEVDAAELAPVLSNEAPAAFAASDRALELLRLAHIRLCAHRKSE